MTKKYILPEKSVGNLAAAVASQEAKLILDKDPESSFYIAEVDEETFIPDNLQALEIQNDEPIDSSAPTETEQKFLDLMLRVQLDEKVDETFVKEILCERINKAIEKAMKELHE